MTRDSLILTAKIAVAFIVAHAFAAGALVVAASICGVRFAS